MAISTVGYARGKRLHLNAIAAAVAIAALAGVAAGGALIAMDGGDGSQADRSGVTRLAPVKEAAAFTMYVVGSEAQKAELVLSQNQIRQFAEVTGEPVDLPAFEVLVIAPDAPDSAWLAVEDSQQIRQTSGLPFTLIDLR